ncbi:uncharacterized protein MELLADRAFT_90243 [Melampsora larici-populina 98AG31]|uniref:Peptide N-acetyl-beta-D-glucosaminyl asparaginase amidase A N-terminal domain-containing protein n=1 Tax=Melampsora larici-populina (strain 98AG31 / pathotype 3-4-7) TaxID=747676 RepID=F4RW88_MELLP|nr:uncharacterized protein MELLADRAFT_90243 [Melampsora larici-populina 98AG31]EGG03240.1 hypothetical protein MELLADRAFT_90243 [Melampsora larici-populina 98AG31]
MTCNTLFKLFLAVYFFIGEVVPSPHLNSRQVQHRPDALVNFEVMAPPVVPKDGKFCDVKLIEHTFVSSYGHPATVNFVPPTNCGPVGSWASVVFTLTATSQGRQYDRLAQLFLNNVEIWRTSTPEPIKRGIIWTVDRDVTRYMPLLSKPNPLTLSLNNTVYPTENLTGQFEVTLSARFYAPTTAFPAVAQLGQIVPLGYDEGSKIEKPLTLPKNTATAFVEIFASGSQQEEFWLQYTNVPDKLLPRLDPKNTGSYRGGGPYREVQLLIDGQLAGVVYPFPVIYTGGILLTWWRPIAAIGASNAPSYTLDITPFVPLLTDDKNHNFTIMIGGQEPGLSKPSWVLSGSVGITLDPSGTRTTGTLDSVVTKPYQKSTPLPDDAQGRINFKTEASRQLSLKATVITGTKGKQSVTVTQDFKFSNTQIITASGDYSNMIQSSEGLSQSVHNGVPLLQDKFSYPMNLTMIQTAPSANLSIFSGQLSHGYTRTEDHIYPAGSKSDIVNTQNSEGNLHFDGKGQAISGIGRTSQQYTFKNKGGDYSRDVEIFNITNVIRNKISGSLALPAKPDGANPNQVMLPASLTQDLPRVTTDSFGNTFLDSPVTLIHKLHH